MNPTPAPTIAVTAASEPKSFSVGTLTYSQQDLLTLFFWLMWNDFTIMLLEQPIAFGLLLQQANGVTNTQLAIFGTVTSILTIWINPFFSTWSDRTRTSLGRRRPFLLAATPPLAVLVMALPFMPDFYHYLIKLPGGAALFAHVHMNGAAFMVGLNLIVLTIFNQVVLALFTYLYWDVVPQEVLGRWTSLTKVVTAAMGLIWNFFLLGLAQYHMKQVCIGISLFSLFVYLLSLWKVKEGAYPPPDKHKTGGVMAPLRAYFVECYSDPFYLWIFFAMFLAGISRADDNVKTHYVMTGLHVSWDIIGKMNAVPLVLTMIAAFYFGSIVDRFHPVRIIAPSYFVVGLTFLGSYFFLTNAWSYLFWNTLTEIARFGNGITYGALLAEIYPREKLGQFCSAAVLFGGVLGFCLGIPLGMFFDWIHSDRFPYLWTAFFLFASSAAWYKVLNNYNKRRGHVPVPHAG